MQEVKPSKKLKLGFISIEGKVVNWFQYYRQTSKNPLGKEFSEVLMRRFRDQGSGILYARLASIRQMGVEKYVQEFELLVSQAKPNSEDQILAYFMKG